MSRKRRQMLECHNCGKVVGFTIDLDLDGNHVFECPNCGHEHCRVVKNGIITDFRWDSRNGPTYQAQYVYIDSASSTGNGYINYSVYASTSC